MEMTEAQRQERLSMVLLLASIVIINVAFFFYIAPYS
jgi:hypothetical protein